ncbi:MAG: nuclear transport factor 2 family protein [Pseudomonadaceae bacterium]|nr:nuclear transport factor 2 family protein [Pseudomonadaceae bacterium]
MRDAKQTIELFWQTQDSGDYTALVPLFSEDAVLVDPIFGTFTGRDAIAGFMAKMVQEMGDRKTHFTVIEISGAGETAWAQWVAHTPAGDVQGCGLYKVRDGMLTYYRDYMNAASS